VIRPDDDDIGAAVHGPLAPSLNTGAVVSQYEFKLHYFD